MRVVFDSLQALRMVVCSTVNFVDWFLHSRRG